MTNIWPFFGTRRTLLCTIFFLSSVLIPSGAFAQEPAIIYGDIDWQNVNSCDGTLEGVDEDKVSEYSKFGVGLFTEDSWDKAFCSGTLIDQETVITAEHCIDDCYREWPPPVATFVGLFYELPAPPELPPDCFADCPAGCENGAQGVDFCYEFPNVVFVPVEDISFVGHDGSVFQEPGQKVDVAILKIQDISGFVPGAEN